MLDQIDDESILDSYYKAIKLNLDVDFIKILKDELDERGIN